MKGKTKEPSMSHEKITSPIRLFIIVAASIFVGETFIMLLLVQFLPTMPTQIEMIFIDALLLTVLLFPVLYFSLFRPIKYYISERNRIAEEQLIIEKQLRQSQKMEAMGTLSGGVAHNFNNILQIIKGYADLAIEKSSAGKPIYKNLVQIDLAAERGAQLLRQLLTFCRHDEKELTPLPLAPLVKEAITMIRPLIPKNIQIRQNIDSHCGCILANANQFHQIIINLATNASHAMKKGGTLEISLEKVRCESDNIKIPDLEEGAYLKLTVRDSGEGMTPEIMHKIFDPFFTTKEVGEGTGLGLSVVHGIIERHHGFITVESDVGKGTAFTMYFPVVENISLQKPLLPVPANGGKERILLVDDEESLCYMFKEGLEQFGYTVTIFIDSIDALTIFQSHPNQFDLVITDHDMPKMDGKHLIQELLTIRSNLPIILLTGYGSDLINNEYSERVGIRKYLTKPVNLNTLNNAVREIMDGKIHKGQSRKKSL